MPNVVTIGTVPTGVTYSFMVLPATSGTGNLDCSTCIACGQHTSLVFDGYGTGWCISVNPNGAGASVPDTHYARPGKFHADCAGEYCVDVQILPCAGGSVKYHELRCLYCGCGE